MNNPSALHFPGSQTTQTNQQIEHPVIEETVGFDGHYDEGEVL